MRPKAERERESGACGERAEYTMMFWCAWLCVCGASVECGECSRGVRLVSVYCRGVRRGATCEMKMRRRDEVYV